MIGLFWLVVIGGLVGYKEFTLRTGQEVLLKTVPVDPRDMFRGDYVTLRYDISRIDLRRVKNDGAIFKSRDAVYVQLDANNKYAVPIGVSKNPPPSGIFIKGVVLEVYNEELSIEYGIESYFVPEGKGLALQHELDKMGALVRVDGLGHAIITSLVLDEKKVSFK